jgi:hypothetical protein
MTADPPKNSFFADGRREVKAPNGESAKNQTAEKEFGGNGGTVGSLATGE